jgi:zinc protease
MPELLHNPDLLKSWTLDNGLRVLVHLDSRLSLVHVHLCCLAGSRHEPQDRSGLAHLCEHLAFTGPTESGETYPELINRVGGATHGLTFHDRTSYADTLPSSQLELGIWMAARRLTAPATGAALERLETQRRILFEERLQQRERVVHTRAFEILHGLLYPDGHAYQRPPGGSPEGIGAILAEDVLRWTAEHYTPDRAILVLVGEVAEDAPAWIEREMGPAERPAKPRPVAAGEPLHVGEERRLAVPDQVNQPVTYVAYSFPGHGSRAWYAAAIVSRALASGRSSPLTRDLAGRRRLAQDVRICLDPMQDATTVAFVATGAHGVSSSELESALIEAVERRIEEGISADDLEHGRKRALIDHYSGLQGLSRRATAIACRAAFAGVPGGLAELAEPYRDLSAEELDAMARRFCRPERRAVLSLLPREMAA